MNWFRVPQWCMAMHDEPSAQRARAWVYLLGAWNMGDDPPTREVRRVTGFGQGRADNLVRDVAAWAAENGAKVPSRLVVTGAAQGGAEQKRSRSGAARRSYNAADGRASERHRSATGAAAERLVRARSFCKRREGRRRGDTEGAHRKRWPVR